MGKTAALLLLLFLLITSYLTTIPLIKASPRTIVVPEDYPTINVAIGNAADGDTIVVKNGTYNETLVIDKSLTLRGEDKETTVINGDNKGTVILIRHDNVEVSGFTVIYDETPDTPKPYWMWSTRLIGIHLLNAKNCNIVGNKISDCGAGIWLYDAHQNKVAGNSIFRCDFGIRVETSTGNSILGNSLSGNHGGMWMLSSSSNKLSGNSMVNNVQNFAIAGSEIAAYLNDVETSNTVEGRPVYYWIGISNRTVPSNAGWVVIVNCKGITVQGLSLSKVQDAIIIANSWGSIVTNNVVTECSGGVKLFNSTNDRIFGNNINSPVGINAVGNGTRIYGNVIKAIGTGIIVDGNYQTVTDNTVEAGTFGAGNKIIECTGSYNNISRNRLIGETYVGISLEGSHNILYENTITKGGVRVTGNSNIIAKNTLTYESISISGGPNNIICANRIMNGYDLGVYGHDDVYYANHVETNGAGARIGGSETAMFNNRLYHNNFIISTRTGPLWGVNRANFWDNGSEGNYWSDYNGTDADGDGIGDTPYFIKSETLDENLRRAVEVVIGQDNYPLMAPFDISTVDVELPEWEVPSWDSEALFPMPSPSPEPTPSGSSEPTPTPSQVPNSTTQAEPIPVAVAATASVGTVVSVVAGLAVYLKKRKDKLNATSEQKLPE